MTSSPRCENCKREFAFGKYRVTKSGYSFWADREDGSREKVWVKQKILLMLLCADCGFNMVRMRKASLAEYELERKPPNGKSYTVREEVMTQKPIYEHVVLIEVLHNATELQYARELQMPPREEYLKQLNHLRATSVIRRDGDKESPREVVVLALGGASARRRVETTGMPPAHSIVTSSATVVPAITATASGGTRASPRRRG